MIVPSVWIVGNEQDAEFVESATLLRKTAEVHRFDHLEAAERSLAESPFVPELLLVLNSFAGQFPPSMLEKLFRKFPLTRCIGVLGAWCEGEPRSGKPWPGITRIYAGRFPAWWREQCRRLQAGEPAAWSLPVLADEVERLYDAQQHTASSPQLGRRIALVARSRAAAAALNDAVSMLGAEIGPLRPEMLPLGLTDKTTLLWDEFDPRRDLPRLHECLQARPDLQTILLVNFPRWNDRQLFQASANVSILAKPFRIEELRAAIS